MKIVVPGGLKAGRTAAARAAWVKMIEQIRPGETKLIIHGDVIVTMTAEARKWRPENGETKT